MKRVGTIALLVPWIVPWIALPTSGAAQDSKPDPVQRYLLELASTDAARSYRAERQLLRMEARAVRPLLRNLKRSERGSLAARRTLEVIGRLGRHGTTALPKLLTRLREADKETEAVLAAIDGLAPFAKDQHDSIVDAVANRWMGRAMARGRGSRAPTHAICRTKIRLDVHSELPLSDLLEKLSSGNSVEREAAAELIVDAEGQREKKLEALLAAFSGGRGSSRVRVRFQTAAMSASISTSVRNDARELRALALAIAELAPTKDVPVKAWIALLDHHDPTIVRRAIQGTVRGIPEGKNRSSAPRAVEKLVALADNENARDRTIAWDAVTALGMLGTHGDSALSPLRRLQTSEDKAIAVRAAAAIRSIERAKTRKTDHQAPGCGQ